MSAASRPLPRPGEPLPVMSGEQVRTLVARARAAQPAWEALGFAGRKKVLLRARALMARHADRYIDAIVQDTRKPYEDAQLEVLSGISSLHFWAHRAEGYLSDEHVRTRNPFAMRQKLAVGYRPRGVIGVIGPWNVPMINSFGDCIPALAAGNAVVLKPSELTPRLALLCEELLREAGMPEDLYSVALGAGPTGEALIDEVDFIQFTGSTTTGKAVATRAIQTLTPYTLELGGKDPLIVCADADLDRAASAAVFYAFANAGQICVSVERVYVEGAVHDAFVERVVQRTQQLRLGLGHGEPGRVDVGPMISPRQADIVKAHIDDAVARGATVLTGGGLVEQSDRFIEPTVLVDVDHTMRCMTEETFGPTLPIMRVRDLEEAISLANDSPYGLGASVFTRDRAKGEAIAQRLQAGTVNVNDAWMSYFAVEVPMGGHKQSGIGARHGAEGIQKFCTKQTRVVARWHGSGELVWYPHNGKAAKLVRFVIPLLYGRRPRG
jgi:acyl-CoA reductase-like NAD-dependent aldehyde dehydrogenase